MLNFLLKRLALAIPTLLAVSFLVFLAARLAPASPIDIIAGEKATPETKARLAHEYGLDRPFLVQYVDYVGKIVLHGDMGRSFSRDRQPVRDMIRQDFPVTAQLAITAILFALIIGLPVGVFAACLVGERLVQIHDVKLAARVLVHAANPDVSNPLTAPPRCDHRSPLVSE